MGWLGSEVSWARCPSTLSLALHRVRAHGAWATPDCSAQRSAGTRAGRGAIWLGTRGRASCCLHWLHLILLGWFLTWPSHLSLPLCKVGTPKLALPVLKAEQTQRMRKCLESTFY